MTRWSMRRGSVVSALSLFFVLVGVAVSAGASSSEEGRSGPPELTELDRAAFSLEPAARELWPGSFGGAWGNAGQGPLKIYVAFTEGAEEKVATLAEGFPEPQMLEPVTVHSSLAELEDLQLKMISEREAAQDAQSLLRGAEGEKYDLGIDYERNAVRVVVPDQVEAARASLGKAYGRAVVVEEGVLSVPQACANRFNCGLQLRAGIGAKFVVPGSGGAVSDCTNAFTVVRPGGAIQILSAAHCGDYAGSGAADIGNQRYHRGSVVPANLYGSVQEQYEGGRVDAERHSIGNGFWGNPWIYLYPGNETWPVKTVGTWAGILINWGQLCKSGTTTGYSCGYVKDKELSPGYIPGGNRFLAIDASSGVGDSGAPFVYAWSQAEAILSGGAGGACGCWTIAGHVEYANSALGVTPYFAP